VSIACSYYLVGGFNHLEKYESMGRMTSHILWKIRAMFENHQHPPTSYEYYALSPTTSHHLPGDSFSGSDPRGIKSKLQRHHIFRLHIPKAGAHTDAN
jgi:hypothetical protein